MAGFRIPDCMSHRAPGRLIRRIDKHMRALVADRLAEIGISYAGWATLKLVEDGVVGTAGELARELGYTTGAATRLIDALEVPRLLDRVRDEADRRVVRLRVTDEGREFVARGLAPVLELWNEMVADFTQAEADQLVALLSKLLATIEARSDGRAPMIAEAAE